MDAGAAPVDRLYRLSLRVCHDGREGMVHMDSNRSNRLVVQDDRQIHSSSRQLRRIETTRFELSTAWASSCRQHQSPLKPHLVLTDGNAAQEKGGGGGCSTCVNDVALCRQHRHLILGYLNISSLLTSARTDVDKFGDLLLQCC